MGVDRYLPLALPRRTLQLFGRYWVPLVTWYLLGNGLHDLLAEVAARVNVLNEVVAYSLLALGILCQLAAYAVMFLVVQPGLPTVWRLRGAGRRTSRELLGAIGIALLPFLLVYSAWDLFQEDLENLQNRTWVLYAAERGWENATIPTRFTAWVIVAAVVAWLLVRACEAVTKRTRSPVTGVLAAVFEANWMCFGFFGLLVLVDNLRDWFDHTVAFDLFTGFRGFVDDVLPALPVPVDELMRLLTFDLGWLDGYQTAVKNGIALPLAWLAIAGACYGRETTEVRPVASLESRLAAAPTALKRWARRFPPQGFREKYYPPLHALQMVGVAGVPALMLFCVCYGAIELVRHLLNQVAANLVGPQPPGGFWQGSADVVVNVVSAATEPVRVCLLAVTIDVALAVFSRRTAARPGTAQASSTTGR